MLHSNKHISFFLRVGYLICAALALYILFGMVLPMAIPLLIAIILAEVVEGPIKFLEKRGVKRKIAGAICTFLCLTLFGFAIYGIGYTAYVQGKNLVSELPAIIASIPDKLESANGIFDKFLSFLPLDQWGFNFDMESIGSFISQIQLPSYLPGIINPLFKAATSIPTILISTVFIFVATYFLSSQRKTIHAFIRAQLSDRVLFAVTDLQKYLSASVFGWIKAQLILIMLTFSELLIGFMIMRLPYALFLALGIAIIDALPILGVGTVLIPWAVISLFTGNFVQALTLCLIYAAVLIVRNSLEPKILGGQIGLHPFVTLLSVYFGYRLGGFSGMFLVPLVVICAKRLQTLGLVEFYKKPVPEDEFHEEELT